MTRFQTKLEIESRDGVERLSTTRKQCRADGNAGWYRE
jgi:hypothetical protein